MFKRAQRFVFLIHLLAEARFYLVDISVFREALLGTQKRGFRIFDLIGVSDRIMRASRGIRFVR